jgi:hypothetical protein
MISVNLMLCVQEGRVRGKASGARSGFAVTYRWNNFVSEYPEDSQQYPKDHRSRIMIEALRFGLKNKEEGETPSSSTVQYCVCAPSQGPHTHQMSPQRRNVTSTCMVWTSLTRSCEDAMRSAFSAFSNKIFCFQILRPSLNSSAIV